MKLAVVSPFVDRRHGTERALAELLERLEQRGHCEIHLYAQRAEDLAIRGSGFEGPANTRQIVWHKVPYIRGPQILQFLAWFLLNSVIRGWHKMVRGVRYDLVLSPGINCLDANVIIVHALFHRLLELFREQERDSARLALGEGLHRRAYYALLASLERKLYANPNISLAAVSPRTGDLLETYFLRKDVAIASLGVDTNQFSPSARLAIRRETRDRLKLRESDFALLLIGNDWRIKGLPVLLDSVAALTELPLRIIVVGEDSAAVFLERARRLGIVERCRFEPTTASVLDFYAAADLYVSPSLEDSFGLPVAEAMACGLPVVTSSFAGVSSLIRNGLNGFVLQDPRDSRELAGLLARIFRDSELRKSIGQAAAQAASQWNWGRHADAVWQLLEDRSKRTLRSS